MAPQIDDEPPAPSVASSSHYIPSSTSPRTHSPMCPPSAAALTPTSTASYTGYHHPRPKVVATAPNRILPRTNARFKVGDSSQLATPSSPAPDSPYSHGSDFESPPLFDVRASFAPMPKWGGAGVDTKTSGSVSTAKEVDKVKQNSRLTESLHEENEVQFDDEEGGDNDSQAEKGIHYGGIQWKGKTAHAVELEMEALGDRTVMSYAPDAVYLASRLEGLKRNLEAGGDRLHRWVWQDFEDVEQHAEEEGETAEEKEEEKEEVFMRGADETKQEEHKDEQVTPALDVTCMDSAVSSLNASEGVTPKDEIVDDPMLATTALTALQDGVAVHDVDEVPTIVVDSTAAKAAALDARVEIRTLRRPDLEQIRELHCYHSDGDKVSFGLACTPFLLSLGPPLRPSLTV
jgi:hypothetical protein